MLATGGEAVKESHPCSDARAIYDFLKRGFWREDRRQEIGVLCNTHRGGNTYATGKCIDGLGGGEDSVGMGMGTASPVLSSIHACREESVGY